MKETSQMTPCCDFLSTMSGVEDVSSSTKTKSGKFDKRPCLLSFSQFEEFHTETLRSSKLEASYKENDSNFFSSPLFFFVINIGSLYRMSKKVSDKYSPVHFDL